MKHRTVPLDDYAREAFAAFLEAKSARHDAEVAVSKARHVIVEFLEQSDADVGMVDGLPVCHLSKYEVFNIDSERLRKERPYIAREYGKPYQVRRISSVGVDYLERNDDD